MYADYIEHQGGDENSIISAEHIDVLTFNRIDFEKLSEMQKRIIGIHYATAVVSTSA